MMTWMLSGFVIAVLITWKVIHDAQVDDKQRKEPRKRGALPRAQPPKKQ